MTHATEDGLELGFMEYCINAQAIEVTEVETIEAAPAPDAE